MKTLYTIFIFLLEFNFRWLSYCNSKIRKGFEGRKKSLEIVQSQIGKKDKVIWMHAASLGEYEQGLPVLEKLKEKYPNYKVLITFFSPSGYENVVNKNHEDILCYLPFDKLSIISKFVKVVQPKIFFTVKYDYWYYLLMELKKQNCKIFVISSLFYPKQIFFKKIGRWMVQQLQKNIDWFFHQNEQSYSLAKQIGLCKGSVSGDTRFDRVKHIQNQNNKIDWISQFLEDKHLLLFGSTWEAEEKIAKFIAEKVENYKIIIAPHDINRVKILQKMFPKALLYSQLLNQKKESEYDFTKSQVLIIDSIGKLARLYSYADVAVVGGGFHTKGLHNILEAATFGIPVIFGNKYKNNPEADELIAKKGGKSFDNIKDASLFLIELCRNSILKVEMAKNARLFINNQPNSSEIILKKIEEIMNFN